MVATRSASCLHDSFEHTKYFGPVSGLSVALAVLDEACAEDALDSMSIARVDGVSKHTGRFGRPWKVYPLQVQGPASRSSEPHTQQLTTSGNTFTAPPTLPVCYVSTNVCLT